MGVSENEVQYRIEINELTNQKIVLIRDDSHKIETHDRVKNALMNQKIDVAFIDGEHSYLGVKKDYDMYKEFVRPGGIMVFHDIVPHSNDRVGVDWRGLGGNNYNGGYSNSDSRALELAIQTYNQRHYSGTYGFRYGSSRPSYYGYGGYVNRGYNTVCWGCRGFF